MGTGKVRKAGAASTIEDLSFNDWITAVAAPLRAMLGMYSDIDEDAFQDTYLRMATDPETPAGSMERRKRFTATYRRHSRRHVDEALTTVRPDETFFLLLADGEEEERDPEAEAAYDEKVRRVWSYIRQIAGGTGIRIIEMRMKGFSVRDLSASFGMPSSRVERVIERAIARTRSRFSDMTLKNTQRTY